MWPNLLTNLLTTYNNSRLQESTRNAPQSLILLDEHNSAQLPRLIQFMVDHGVHSIDPAVQALVKRIEKQTEAQRNRRLVAFCPDLLLLGECFAAACAMRHTLVESDRSRATIPRHGVVQLIVMEVLSPTHYAARLVAHRASGSDEWTALTNSAEYLNFGCRFQSYYSQEENQRPHAGVQVGDLCVIAEGNAYRRCQIAELK